MDAAAAAEAERQRFEANLPRLARFLREACIADATDISIERQFDAGQSNPTYLLRIDGRRIVLRKQPYGELLPRAHDVAREHDIMSGLGRAVFRVPRVLVACRDKQVIGTDFFAMEFVSGDVHSDASLPSSTTSDRGRIYRSIAQTLGTLHQIDPSVLSDAGVRARPDFLARQISVWHGAYRATLVELDDRIDSIARWLVENRPASTEMRIVHGDYRLENLIVEGGEVSAVLDWELCSIGDPLADLAHCCIWYHLPSSAFFGLADSELGELGIPSESEFISHYERAAQIDARANHAYYMAFACYRLASILQGVYRRGLDGNAASPLAIERGKIAGTCLSLAAGFAAAA